MFKSRPRRKLKVTIKGLFSPSIPYEVRITDLDWTPYESDYEQQRYGSYDTNSCWCLATVKRLETQLNWLWAMGMFSEEAKKFFIPYLNQNGRFAVSERLFEILGKNGDSGGTAEEAGYLMAQNGIIPRSMLAYTLQQANSWGSKQLFNQDYFNPNAVTPQMIELGKQSLRYIKIAYQKIGKNWTTPDFIVLQNALKQAPPVIGIPIPNDVSKWNGTFIQYDGGKTPQHEVGLYKLIDDSGYPISDQYQPPYKKLSKDYYIPFCTQLVVTAIQPVAKNPIYQNMNNNSFWENVWAWFIGNKLPYPNVPIGSNK